MKKLSILITAIICILLCSCSDTKDELVGKWVDNTTEQIIEYTGDGYYYEYVNESFTSDKTKYRVSGDMITYYIEGEEESEFSVEYSLDGDTLTIGGVLEYRRMEIPEEKE